MNKIIARIKIKNIFVPFLYIAKSSKTPDRDRQKEYQEREEENFNLLMKQGFIWYPDFIAFNMLSDYREYWIEITISDNLKLDSVIAIKCKLNNEYDEYSAIVLPFQIIGEELIYLFGDNDRDINLSFTLPVGHYQLLFQNRFFSERQSDLELNNIELCLLTFIPTQKAIEPKILADNDRLENKNFPSHLILYDNGK